MPDVTARVTPTERERQCLKLVSKGLTSKQIAIQLSIAERTVETHMANAMRKLGAQNRAHAIAEAIRQGWLM